MNFNPNPLFFEMAQVFQDNYNEEDKVVICNEGGTRCFSKDTKVLTSKGYKNISLVKNGDKVLTYNEASHKKEFKKVNESLKFKNTKKTYKVKMKSGVEFVATEDHEFYYKGGWVSLKHLLSLLNEK
jgi:intein/homing endonuclease